MKILVFGGTFNPPHLGHQAMVKEVLSRPCNDGFRPDQLWFLPVGQHSFNKQFVSNRHRVAMLNLVKEDLVAENTAFISKIAIEEYELRHDGESQTFNTLEALAQLHSQHQFAFLIGSDNLSHFYLWKNYQAMLKKYPFYVYPRLGFDFKPLYKGMVALQGFPKIAISSTKVRAAFKNNSSLQGLLSAKVIAYIKQEQLFSKGE